MSEADGTEKKAEETLKQYNAKFRQARKEALELKRKLILEGTEKKEAAIDKAKKEAQGFLEEMRKNIAEEAKQTNKSSFTNKLMP